jgi:hypothetical protein
LGKIKFVTPGCFGPLKKICRAPNPMFRMLN